MPGRDLDMAPERSYFENGTYHGYEIRLRLERNGHENRPYSIRSSRDVFRLMRPLADESAEYLYSISLDNRNRVTGVYLVAKGACDRAAGDPREFFKAALLTNAGGIIMCHNHPSGQVSPSQRDYYFTERIRDGGQLLNIRLLDSVIIGAEGDYFSMADKGLLGKDLHRLSAIAIEKERRQAHLAKTGVR